MPKGYKKDGSYAGKVFKAGERGCSNPTRRRG